MEKYGTAGQATEENIGRRMSFTSWKAKAKNKHSEYITIIIDFQ
jgi:hypothetical protein